jgi:hypothetical protein
MAFIVEDNNIISFAEFQDVQDRDQRLFDNNESLTDDVVENLLIRATERILSKIRSTQWWGSYFLINDNGATTIVTRADIPSPDANKIIGRSSDFTDLCVFSALADYILPFVADFGTEINAEREKMGYYKNKSDELFMELISAGDWYDFDDSGAISASEKLPGQINLKRVR